MLKKWVCIFPLFFLQLCYAQFTDSFTDGDFTTNPTWTGNNTNYEVDASFMLHLNAPAQTDTSYLSTPSLAINNTIWEFFVRMTFNPSSSNYAKVYLVSDQADLKGPLNGYFIKVGNTQDEISLYRQDGLTENEIIDGIDSRVGTDPVNVSIRVTRDNLGNWQVLSDTTGGTTYVLEGSGLENTYTTSSFFGVSSRYTSSRSVRFYYDNFNVTTTGLNDTDAPTLDSLVVVNSTNLNAYFNEPVDLTTAQTLTNYSVDLGIGNPSAAIRDATDSSLVHLTFNTPFVNGQGYNLTITNVEDTTSNAITSIVQAFTHLLVVNPNLGDVVINEIFADPSPQLSLPVEEFVELYNTSNNVFTLNNWQFVNTTTIKVLPSFTLAPKGYVILCDVNDTNLYSPFGNVIGISSFSALTNGGDSLTLMDNNNNVLDIVVYDMSWYQDNLKEDGGWSLERINPNHPCSNSLNWIASTDPNGGTPGVQNSVFDTLPDTQPPTISTVNINQTSQINMSFNETMDSTSLANATYTITGGISVTSVIINNDNQGVTLVVTPNLDSSIVYSITIIGAKDCSRNIIEPNNTAFALPEQGAAGDLIINEVLFNPFTGGSDFVEIYNNSNKFINLQNWNLANLENGRIDNHKELTDVSKLILPGEFVLLTKAAQNVADEYINSVSSAFLEMESLPSYNDDDGNVYLINNLDMVVDHFRYNEDMHFALLNNENGVSLERIDYNRPTNDETNWHSAAEAIGFATPGYENSQYMKSTINSEEIVVAPATFSPDNDGVDDVVSISYNFSKPGFVANIVIYDAKGRLVKNFIQNELLGIAGTYSWDGINENNEKARVGIYIIFVEAFDIEGNVKSFKKPVVLAGQL